MLLHQQLNYTQPNVLGCVSDARMRRNAGLDRQVYHQEGGTGASLKELAQRWYDHVPPEPRKRFPSLTWGCLSSRCLSGQISLSEENTTLCLACWNFRRSSLGPEAKTAS